MPENIHTLPKLLVISDTGMYQKDKNNYAFGPVVRELEELDIFKDIVWLGFNRIDQITNRSYIKIADNSIKLKFLKKTGGQHIIDKLSILIHYPYYFISILKEIYSSTYIHVRAPSHPAVLAILFSFFFPKKKFWFKYAGDWEGRTGKFYSFQRKWLKKLPKNSKVTINGNWPKQPKHCITFENPCLTAKDRELGNNTIERKKWPEKLDFCFVGGLNENKGGLLLLKALKEIKEPSKIGALYIVGDGHLKEEMQKIANKLNTSVIFYGALPKDEVIKIYEKSHFIVLPSQSEGFPKVIGEAMNFGCVPVVSNVSCIDQYIQHGKNGFLLKKNVPNSIAGSLKNCFNMTAADFHRVIAYNYALSEKFTYKKYNIRIKKEIFN